MNKIVFSAVTILILLFCLLPNHHYWTISKDNGIYWFKSPKGNLEFISAVTTVQPEQNALKGQNYVSTDFNGDYDNWAKKTAIKVKESGFKAIGAWSNQSIFPYMPHTVCLNLLASTTIPISSPEWEEQIEKLIRQQVTPNDDNLIGYYLDNEVQWKNIPQSSVAKYFEVIHKLIKKYDPNHLILGVRFNSEPSDMVLIASIGKVDAHSVNLYSDAIDTYEKRIERINRITNCPIIISEFSFYSAENSSGNRNFSGFGGFRETQDDRCKAYRDFVTLMESKPFVIGCEWFQWNDEPPYGRVKDGEDCNFGIVDIFDKPYKICDTIKEVSSSANNIHCVK